MSGVDRNAGDWTHLYALGLIKMTDAFGALVGVDLVDFRTEVNRLVGALGLAHIAIDAFNSDHQGHGSAPQEIRGLLDPIIVA